MAQSPSTPTTFGPPEWLAVPKGAGEPKRHDDVPLGRSFFSPSKKVEMRFTRSKSTPLLDGSESKQDGFSMLNKQYTFEHNFPTLTTASSCSAASSTKDSNCTVWKQGGHSVEKATESTVSGQGNGSDHRGVSHDREEYLRNLVPHVQPIQAIAPQAKPLTRRDMLSSSKKDSKGRKKYFDPTLLRKASSAPSLPIPDSYHEQYEKMMAQKKEAEKTKEKATEKPKSGQVVLNRNDFFKGLVKQPGRENENVQKVSLVVEPIKPVGPQIVLTPPPPSMKSQLPVSTFEEPQTSKTQASKRLSVEAEENFLRTLGWVPEEEDHVPELTEEEIQEVKRFIENKQTPIHRHHNPVHLWKNDNRFAVQRIH